MPAFFLIAPPPAYIETVHGLAAMTADYEQWCVPAAEVPEAFRPAHRSRTHSARARDGGRTHLHGRPRTRTHRVRIGRGSCAPSARFPSARG